MGISQRALFLDRDGVVNKTVKRYDRHHKKIIDNSPCDVKQLRFSRGITDLVEKARVFGYKVIIVTNQPSVIKGDLTLTDYERITTKICEHLHLPREDVFECFHKEGYSLPCKCRKPEPGLFLMAKGMHNLNLEESVMVGDSWVDIKAACSVGCKTVYLNRKKDERCIGNEEDRKMMKDNGIFPDYFCNNLYEVIKIIDKER